MESTWAEIVQNWCLRLIRSHSRGGVTPITNTAQADALHVFQVSHEANCTVGPGKFLAILFTPPNYARECAQKLAGRQVC